MEGCHWGKYPSRIVVGYYPPTCEEAISGLCRLVLCLKERFVSITKSVDEITVMYDELLRDIVPVKPQGEIIYIAYTLLNVGSFLEESGLITSVAKAFTEREIPIMYTTTCNNNYLLIPESFEEKANELLSLRKK